MAQVDTSIYQNQTAPTNPLTTIGNLATVQNSLNQNKLFQQQNSARQAIGQAYQQSIDPATGQLDTNKLMQNIAGNPAAAYMAGDVSAQALQRQQTQQAITGQQIDQGQKKLQWIYSQTGTLMANPNVSRTDVVNTLVDGLNSGILSKNDVVNEISNMPSDPAQLHGYLQQHQLKAMDQAQQYGAIYGSPQLFQDGQTQSLKFVSPMTGIHDSGFSVQNQLSPQDLSAPKTWYDPATKTTRTGTTQQWLQATGGGNGQAGASPAPTPPIGPNGLPLSLPEPPAGLAAAAGLAPTKVNGLIDQLNQAPPSYNPPSDPPDPRAAAPSAPATQPVATTSAAPSVAPTSSSSVGLPAGPALGDEAAANVTGTAAANQGVALQQTADAVPQRKAALDNLLTDLQNFTSGPGADWSKVAKAGIDKWNPFGNIFDPQGISSQEAFTKQATQLATAQLQSLGGTGTDSKLDAAMHSNPGELLSKLGNQQIIGLLKGNEDAISAKNQEWQSYLQNGGSAKDYGAFSTQFNKQYDPRVFQSQYMGPAQKADLVKSMSKPELAQFQKSYNYAAGRGWLTNAPSAQSTSIPTQAPQVQPQPSMVPGAPDNF